MDCSTEKPFDGYTFQEELSLVFVCHSNSSRDSKIRVHNEFSCIINSLCFDIGFLRPAALLLFFGDFVSKQQNQFIKMMEERNGQFVTPSQLARKRKLLIRKAGLLGSISVLISSSTTFLVPMLSLMASKCFNIVSLKSSLILFLTVTTALTLNCNGFFACTVSVVFIKSSLVLDESQKSELFSDLLLQTLYGILVMKAQEQLRTCYHGSTYLQPSPSSFTAFIAYSCQYINNILIWNLRRNQIKKGQTGRNFSFL